MSTIEELNMTNEQLADVMVALMNAMFESIDWNHVKERFFELMGDGITDDQRQMLDETLSMNDSDVDELLELLNGSELHKALTDDFGYIQDKPSDDDDPEDEPEE